MVGLVAVSVCQTACRGPVIVGSGNNVDIWIGLDSFIPVTASISIAHVPVEKLKISVLERM